MLWGEDPHGRSWPPTPASPTSDDRPRRYAGVHLPPGPTGTLGIGLGAGGSTGTPGLIRPTLEITHTGQEEVVDGVRTVFQMTPGTECPAEMNFAFPDRRALCLSENATHNLLTLRGAQVRDPRIWSRYLNEAVDVFARHADVAFASHHWPTWGTDAIVTFLVRQRDLYAYLHDQTLRLINQGYVASASCSPCRWSGSVAARRTPPGATPT